MSLETSSTPGGRLSAALSADYPPVVSSRIFLRASYHSFLYIFAYLYFQTPPYPSPLLVGITGAATTTDVLPKTSVWQRGRKFYPHLPRLGSPYGGRPVGPDHLQKITFLVNFFPKLPLKYLIRDKHGFSIECCRNHLWMR